MTELYCSNGSGIDPFGDSRSSLSALLSQPFIALPTALCAYLGNETRAKVLSFIYGAWQSFTGIEVNGEKYVYLSYQFIGDRIWRKLASTKRAVDWLVQEGYLLRGQYLKYCFNAQLSHHREYCYRPNPEKLELLQIDLAQESDYSFSNNLRSLPSDPKDQTTKISIPLKKNTDREDFPHFQEHNLPSKKTDLDGKKEHSTSPIDVDCFQTVTPQPKLQKDSPTTTKQTPGDLDPLLEEILQSLKNLGVVINGTILNLIQSHPLERVLNAKAAMEEVIQKGIQWRVGPTAWIVRAIQQGFKPRHQPPKEVIPPYHRPYTPPPDLSLQVTAAVPPSGHHLSLDPSHFQVGEGDSSSCVAPQTSEPDPIIPADPLLMAVQPTLARLHQQPASPLQDLSDMIVAIKTEFKVRGIDLEQYCQQHFRRAWRRLSDAELAQLYMDL